MGEPAEDRRAAQGGRLRAGDRMEDCQICTTQREAGDRADLNINRLAAQNGS